MVCVGKLKEKFWAEAVAEYAKRLRAFCKLDIREVADVDPAKAGGEEAARTREGVAICAALPQRAHVVLLAIEGKPRSSEQLAQRLDQLALSGASDIAFVIGGSCGVSPDVYARANETLSFGPITLPHNLARVVLMEQVYRAFKINRHEPYHK